jgi:hypothetical protein
MDADEELQALDMESIKFDPESRRMAEMALFKDIMTAIRSRMQPPSTVGTTAVEGLADSLRELGL